MMSILVFVAGAALLIFSAEKLIGYLIGVARGLRISVFLIAIIFTGIEFDDIFLGVALNLEELDGVALGIVFGTTLSMIGISFALAAILAPTKVTIPKDYVLILAVSPLLMVGFILTAPLTAVHGVLLLGCFVAFVSYVAVRELRSDGPVFRDAELYEAYPLARVAGSNGGVLLDDEVGASWSASDSRNQATVGRNGEEYSALEPFVDARGHSGWTGLGLAVLALVGLIAGAMVTGIGTEGILGDFGLDGTIFGATILTVVLTIEDIFLTVEPARRGAPEIALGNVIGSVVFSVTGKLGIIVLAGSLVVTADALTWHLPVLAVLVGLAAYFIASGRLKRWHGLTLLGLYVAYWVISFFAFGIVPVEVD